MTFRGADPIELFKKLGFDPEMDFDQAMILRHILESVELTDLYLQWLRLNTAVGAAVDRQAQIAAKDSDHYLKLAIIMHTRVACQSLGTSTNRFKYVGSHHLFIGATALGRMRGGKFEVQVDQFNHPLSHFWHDADLTDWAQI